MNLALQFLKCAKKMATGGLNQGVVECPFNAIECAAKCVVN